MRSATWLAQSPNRGLQPKLEGWIPGAPKPYTSPKLRAWKQKKRGASESRQRERMTKRKRNVGREAVVATKKKSEDSQKCQCNRQRGDWNEPTCRLSASLQSMSGRVRVDWVNQRRRLAAAA